MFRKRTISRIYGALLGMPAAMYLTFFAYKAWHLRTLYVATLFVILCILFCRLGVWFMVERPEELDKKYPITGKELRERRDRFFAELDAQNPPPPYSKYRKEPPL